MRALDRRLVRSSRVARLHLVVAVVLGFVVAVATLAQALLLAHVVARVFRGHATFHAVRWPLLAVALAGLVRGLAAWGSDVSGRIGAARVMSDLRRRLVAKLIADGAPFSDGTRGGELSAMAVQGVDALEAYFARYLPQLVLAALAPLTVLGWVVHVDPISAAILAATVPLIPFFMVLIGKSAERHARARFRALGELSGRFLDLVRGLPTLRAFNRTEAQAASLQAAGERYRTETMGTLRIAFLSALVLELLAMLGTAMVAVVVGTRLARGGGISFEHALAVLILAPELYLPLRQLGAQFHSAADGLAVVGPIFEALDTPPSIAAERASCAVPDLRHSAIRFEGVGFAYSARPERVLDGFDLELRPGECVALLGPSGTGKTTIASLLLRFAEPLSGRVVVGGSDLRDLDLAAWRASLAWLPQRPHLFAGTIAENITLADPGADLEAIRRATGAAGAGFVDQLPDGFETRIGEGGWQLSAGEARRIGLARALLRDVRVLVLDEPTAHLDADTAASVADAIVRVSTGRTTLLITHDEALARRADRVICLAGGRAVTGAPIPLAA
jgi:thiol reductant ABC exporter CydD subunit